MRIAAPWLLLLVPVLAWYVQRAHARSFVGPARAMLVARIVLITVILAALARPEISLPSRHVELLTLVDDSASLLPSRREAIRGVVRELGQANPGMSVWRFGDTSKPASVEEPLSATPQANTRLERALFAAEAALPEGGARRIVLVSDGRETEGDVRRAARALGEEKIPVYPVRLPQATDPEVLLVDVRAPEGLRRGEQIELTVSLRSTLATSARLSISEGGRTIYEEPVSLRAGDSETRAAVSLQSSGLVRLRAEVFPERDTLRENNVREQTLYVEGPPRVLLGTPTMTQQSALADALMLQGIDVIRFDKDGLPQSLEELAAFDAVILDEIGAGQIDYVTQELFESYVRDLGGGLLYVTGHTGLGSFDRNAPLQRVLPVSSEERVENQVPPVAMVLVVDRSGSMEGEKLQWTKRAALGTMNALPPDAQLGVIAFDAEFRWIAPLKAVSNKQQIADEINALAPGGGTRFFPALENAYYSLGASNASVKHIVLLTDGLSTDGVDFRPLARKMAASGITLSTVAMSSEADIPLLKDIAKIAGGRAFVTKQASEVATIFADESRLATKRAQVDKPFRPKQEAFLDPIARVDFEAAPRLYGFVATTLRTGAEQVLSVEGKQPLMARWRYGLGQVVAFTSDTDGSWAREWAAWPEYPRMWSELIRHTMRDRSGAALLVDGRVVEGALEVVVDIDEARARATKDLEVELYAVDPSLVAQKVELVMTGPGQLRGRLPWTADGSVVLRCKAQQHGQVVASATRILDRPYAREFTLGDDEDTLHAVAQLSGGEVLDAAAVGRLAGMSASRRVPLAPYLLGLAFVLFFVDLYIKRVRPTAQRV